MRIEKMKKKKEERGRARQIDKKILNSRKKKRKLGTRKREGIKKEKKK